METNEQKSKELADKSAAWVQGLIDAADPSDRLVGVIDLAVEFGKLLTMRVSTLEGLIKAVEADMEKLPPSALIITREYAPVEVASLSDKLGALRAFLECRQVISEALFRHTKRDYRDPENPQLFGPTQPEEAQ